MRIVLQTAVITAAVVASFFVVWSFLQQPAAVPTETDRFAARESPVDSKKGPSRYMFNVTLHTPEEIGGMLRRAEELAGRELPVRPDAGIALVLHGPEIKLFTKQGYAANKALVDLARRLDGKGVIEIKMCQTAMRNLGVKAEDVPDFISFVPYAPDEIKRLEAEGYVYL